jgi:hypothetical protein
LDHSGFERLQAKGLWDHRHSPFAGASHHGPVIVGRDDEDGHRWGAVPDGLDDVLAAHLRHFKVGEHKIPAALVEANEAGRAIGR